MIAESKRSLDVKPFIEPSITFSLVLKVVPRPISEAPHETGASGFVDVS